jgi:predicted PhzF superfamily epimerase YddE/YHI9
MRLSFNLLISPIKPSFVCYSDFMSTRINVHVVRVFTDELGNFGNPVGVVIDERGELGPEKRQAIATNLNFSETVFINNLENADVSIFNPMREVPFAGHALVGAAWLLCKLNATSIETITCQGKHIQVVNDEGLTWIIANLALTPPWQHEQLANAGEVKRLLAGQKPLKAHTYVWAWIEQTQVIGQVRARTFAPDWGIPEDEANGSGSMQLAATLGRRLQIMHGKGSIIHAMSGINGVAVGELVVENSSLTI